jgi:hypothetical protein
MKRAPFIFAFHDDASEWHNCPLIKALAGCYVRLTTTDDVINGYVREIHADGQMIVERNAHSDNPTLCVVGIGALTEVYYY